MANYYLTFDGTGTATITPPSTGFGYNILTYDFSFCWWMKKDASYSTSSSKIFEKYGTNTGYGIFVTRDWINIYIAASAAATRTISFTTHTVYYDSQWHHYCITVDRDSHTGVKLYVDGVYIESGDFTTIQQSVTTAAPLVIGDDYIGSLDDLRMYRICLTAQQVSDIYYDGHGWKVNEDEFGSLSTAGFYSDCDDGTGTSLATRRLSLATGLWDSVTATLAGGVTWGAGGVPINVQSLTDDFEEYTLYINRTSKRIQFRFKGKDKFYIREFMILSPEIQNDR